MTNGNTEDYWLPEENLQFIAKDIGHLLLSDSRLKGEAQSQVGSRV